MEAETQAFFTEIYGRINNTLSVFVNLPLEKLDTETLRRKLADLGELSRDVAGVTCPHPSHHA